MTETRTAPGQLDASGRRGQRPAAARLQHVGDFVGELANEAAQAVRRSGLKPGLGRSFGCEPQASGRVVAQEPEPGARLARNGLVVLYVAAPGATAETEQIAGPDVLAPPDPELETQALEDAEPASLDDPPCWRRKPGRSNSAPVLDVAPAPRLPGQIASVERSDGPTDDHGAIAGRTYLAEPSDETEEYVIAAETLLTRGRQRASRPAAGTPIAWMGEQLRRCPKLLRAAIALLVLWLLVAGGAALLAHGSKRAVLSHSPATRAAVGPQPRQAAPRQSTAPRKRAPRPAHHRKRPSSARRREARSTVKQLPSAPPPSPSSVTRPAVSGSPTPAPRHEGGLFSP